MSLFVDASTGEPVDFEIRDVVLAGYTGREQEEVRKHVEELAAHGVPAPERVPCYYRVTPDLVVVQDSIDVLGSGTSGEVEFILLRAGGEWYVGLGSDHTDRDHERLSITHSKQLCAKVVCPQLWRLSEVAPHWDQVILRAFSGPEQRLYQEGPATAMLDPDDILARVEERTGNGLDGVLVFSGTIPLTGELECAERFGAELHDQATGLSLRLDYRVNVMQPLD